MLERAMTSRAVGVAVVEDNREIREGLESLISGADGFTCTGAFRTMEDALAAIPQAAPDIVLLDLGLPGMDGIEGAAILKERFPMIEIVVLTVYRDDERIFRALCAGASGYLLKNTTSSRLVECLREVSEGGAPMSPEVARRMLNLFRDFRPPPQAGYDLTPHERRLLGMLVEGHTVSSAAAELGVSANTVKFHVKHVYEKLQVHSKSQAVAKALRERLTN